MAGKIADISHSERRQDVSNLPRPNTGMFALCVASTKNLAMNKNPFFSLVLL